MSGRAEELADRRAVRCAEERQVNLERSQGDRHRQSFRRHERMDQEDVQDDRGQDDQRQRDEPAAQEQEATDDLSRLQQVEELDLLSLPCALRFPMSS